MTTSCRTDALRRTVAAIAGVLALSAVAAAPAGAAKLTAKADPEAITFERGSVAIEGTLTGDAGISAAGRVLKLYERPYPYKRAKQIAVTQTADDGSYSFDDVEPAMNSMYKVAINDTDLAARSKSELVVVFAQGDIKVRTTRSRQVASSFSLAYSPKLKTALAGRKVLWYFNEIGKPRFTVADRSRSKQPRKGLLTGRSRFKAPPGEYRFRITYCLDIPDDRDIGIGPPGAPRNCPNSFPAAASRALRTVGSGTATVAAGAVVPG